mgnify:CR=1 FL=1
MRFLYFLPFLALLNLVSLYSEIRFIAGWDFDDTDVQDGINRGNNQQNIVANWGEYKEESNISWLYKDFLSNNGYYHHFVGTSYDYHDGNRGSTIVSNTFKIPDIDGFSEFSDNDYYVENEPWNSTEHNGLYIREAPNDNIITIDWGIIVEDVLIEYFQQNISDNTWELISIDLPNHNDQTYSFNANAIGIDNLAVYEYEDLVPLDSDGDGVVDSADAFPNDPTETVDTDGDGVGDNTDTFPSIRTQDIINDVISNPSLYNIYSIDFIKDLRPGSTMIQISGNQATVQLQMEESSDLQTWEDKGDPATMTIPADTDTKFFRFKMAD